MPKRIEFEADDVGFEESDGILNVWFADQEENYLAFDRVTEDHEADYDDLGCVRVEVNDQINACSDGFETVVLEPHRIVVRFVDEEVMHGLTSVIVHFELGEAFESLRPQFDILMRKKSNYEFVADAAGG